MAIVAKFLLEYFIRQWGHRYGAKTHWYRPEKSDATLVFWKATALKYFLNTMYLQTGKAFFPSFRRDASTVFCAYAFSSFSCFTSSSFSIGKIVRWIFAFSLESFFWEMFRGAFENWGASKINWLIWVWIYRLQSSPT